MTNSKRDTIMYAVVCATALLLFVPRYTILGCSIIVVLLLYLSLIKGKLKFSMIHLFFVYFIIMNFIHVVFVPDQNAIEEIQRNIIYILLSVLLANIKIPYNNIIIIWRVMIFFCLGIQVMQVLKIGNINNVLTLVYGESTFLRQASYDLLRGFRSGSIFMSINPYFKFTTMCLCLFLHDAFINSSRKGVKWLFIFFSLVSSFLIGSRTAFIIIIAIFAYWFFLQKKTFMKPFSVLFSIVAIVMVLGVSFRVFYIRFFDIFETGSLAYKLEKIEQFLSDSHFVVILFGNGAYALGSELMRMDSDLGYILSYYGVVGLFLYTSMLLYTVKYARYSNLESSKQFSISVGIAIFLSTFVSGVYLNYRVYSMILICIISYKNALGKPRSIIQKGEINAYL